MFALQVLPDGTTALDLARQKGHARVVEALEEAGVFSLVLEGMPSDLAARITGALEIPTIGIGAGGGCDGQILVFSDLLGLSAGQKPKFVRKYADLRSAAIEAIRSYCRDVRDGDFPSASETYGKIPEKRAENQA